MSRLIRDYLQTQALNLDTDAVRIAQTAAEAVIQHGQAVIENAVLWGGDPEIKPLLLKYLTGHENNERCLKQIFMALDSACARQSVHSAAVYVLVQDRCLLRLVQQGQAAAAEWPLNEWTAECCPAVRTAQTGWLNLIDDTAAWAAGAGLQDAAGRFGSQISLPVCTESGKVLGVLDVTHTEVCAFAAAEQAEWVGLALALSEPLQALLLREDI